ncbi:MAG TPA: M23 family metallopeptidase [Rhizomicrobium sp.]|jgi:murein DD-endopeptidase MepM/ murein hydrolase activator NlpD
MRAQQKARGNLKRITALALCVAGAAMLSGCETYQDARESYRDFYDSSAPYHGTPHTEYRRAAAARDRSAPDRQVASNDDSYITPRKRPAYTPAPRIDSTPQDARVGDTLTSGFVVPVSGKIIAGFGSYSTGERNDGINIAAATGTPIHAAADGVVTYAGNELKGYGNLILIKHGDTYVTAYAHTNSIGVARGQRVAKGDIIGTVGQTGDVTQPQLHFEIRRNMKPIDPRAILTASNDS